MDLYIQTKTGVELIDAYKLHNGLAAHKSPYREIQEWIVVDIDSGLYVKRGLKTLKECYQYADANPDADRLVKARRSKLYKDSCKKIAEWKKREME